MAEADPNWVDRLVEPARVHKDVYTSQAVFDLEMERIFGQAWVYVGHESQVKNHGDCWTTMIGKEPVVMTRDSKDQIHVLYNRCPHKGAKLAAEGCSNHKPMFRCPYHAWTFRMDGSLVSVPHKHGYDDTGFDVDDPNFSMKPVERVESYRGFVFCSLSESGPDLKTFLGGAITSMDNFVDRAPDGEIEVAGGVQRVMQRSNWKIFFENLNDTGHPIATHESSFLAARKTSKHKLGGEVPFQLHIIEGNGEPPEFWESLDLRAFDYGHSFMTAIFHAPKGKISEDYKAALDAAKGKEKADEIVGMNRHNTIVYPSCSPHTGFHQLRVIRPVSINRTMVEIFTFKLKGTSDEYWQRTITYSNIVNSPSSTVMVDDVEVYERCQEGMESDGMEWISQHRGEGRDNVMDREIQSEGISEMPIRNQFRAWSHYMTGTPASIPGSGGEK
ncbi:MAG: aromatic ring-hydroxylating dioxygenase subunit alpha [Pseudomonadota bacterium]